MIASPAQVGHEAKRPRRAPTPPNQLILAFLVRKDKTKLAKLALRPTSHEIEKRRSRLTGTKRSPRCWEKYATTSGISPTGPQQVATAYDGIPT
jgi:hypothetical protein